jgi:hypothetical protein
MSRTGRNVLFRSSAFSKANTFLPLAGAVLVAVMITVTPPDMPGAEAAYYVGAATIVMMLAAALLFNRLAVTFDGREIVLAYSIIKKRIPLEKVYAVGPHAIKWSRFGGTGIRFTGGGWAWITGSGPGVKIETTRGTTYANCENAERLVALVGEYKHDEGRQT